MHVLAATLNGTKNLALEEKELSLAEDEVLVRTHSSSICDADLRAYLGMDMPEDLPSFKTIGHEGGGTVVAIGAKVREYKEGDKVMLFGPHNSFADHFKSKVQNVHPAPEGLDMDIAALGEPTAVGVFGVFESEVQLGDTIVVAGLNYQGLIAVQGLKKKGASKLIAVDYSDAHLDLAANRGADVLVNTERDDALEAVLEETGGDGADLCFHSCGYWNPRAEEYFNLCADATRDEGRIVSLPDMMSPITAKLHRVHHHAMDIKFPAVMHHGPEFRFRWVPRLMRPVVDGTINVRDLITAEFSLDQVVEGMELFREDQDQVKVVLRPESAR